MLWSHDGVDGTRVAARQVLRAVTISLLSRAADFSGSGRLEFYFVVQYSFRSASFSGFSQLPNLELCNP